MSRQIKEMTRHSKTSSDVFPLNSRFKLKKNSNGLVKKISFRKLIKLPSTTFGTFGLYRYPAKFIPHVVAYTLANYTTPDMKIFDPFGGYGTTGVVSRIYGNDYEMWDLNPMIEVYHKIAISKPVKKNFDNLPQEMKSKNKKFIPDWSRLEYWYPKSFLPFLYKMWGFYHSLPENDMKLILTLPLLKVTRYFSYDDPQRQKLTASPKSRDRIEKLLNSDWKKIFFQLLDKEIIKIQRSVDEHHSLKPKKVKGIVKGGVDSFTTRLKEKKDVLITSPPYLQSQEYIRHAKLDLFWLGHSEEEVRKIGKLEIPYREINECEIFSKKFARYSDAIKEPHIKKIFDRYFWGLVGSLTRLEKDIDSYMFLFVGHSSSRGRSIPIDKILIEHFTNMGWIHRTTLVDEIVNRRLFSYKVNPASHINDVRTPMENLVVLQRS